MCLFKHNQHRFALFIVFFIANARRNLRSTSFVRTKYASHITQHEVPQRHIHHPHICSPLLAIPPLVQAQPRLSCLSKTDAPPLNPRIYLASLSALLIFTGQAIFRHGPTGERIGLTAHVVIFVRTLHQVGLDQKAWNCLVQPDGVFQQKITARAVSPVRSPLEPSERFAPMVSLDCFFLRTQGFCEAYHMTGTSA